eukprot:4992281-Prymnesium_polylepis.1
MHGCTDARMHGCTDARMHVQRGSNSEDTARSCEPPRRHRAQVPAHENKGPRVARDPTREPRPTRGLSELASPPVRRLPRRAQAAGRQATATGADGGPATPIGTPGGVTAATTDTPGGASTAQDGASATQDGASATQD